jgi:anti-sigma-K factor RskA
VSAAEHDRFQDDVGAYLLGALDDGERSDFERHVATCHVCQDELDRLQSAADALPRSVEQYEPPPSLKHALMEQVHAEAPAEPVRRRWSLERFRLTMPRLAAAAATLLVGVLAGYALSSGGGDGGGARTISASVDATRIGDARATLVSDGRSHLQVAGMPQLRRGQVYEIWLKRGNRIDPGPLFAVDRNGNGVGAVPGDLDGVSAVMVTRERAGGARQPTEAPVVTART